MYNIFFANSVEKMIYLQEPYEKNVNTYQRKAAFTRVE